MKAGLFYVRLTYSIHIQFFLEFQVNPENIHSTKWVLRE